MAIHSHTDKHIAHIIQPLHSASQRLRMVVDMSKQTAYLKKQDNLSLVLLYAHLHKQ